MKNTFQKGDTINFLDYQIHHCTNNDGIVLMKEKEGKLYEAHLGNYSTLDSAKKAAIYYFMIARPERFATHIFHRLIGLGTMHEYFAFKAVCSEEGIDIPEEITCHGFNFFIGYNGKKLTFE